MTTFFLAKFHNCIVQALQKLEKLIRKMAENFTQCHMNMTDIEINVK